MRDRSCFHHPCKHNMPGLHPFDCLRWPIASQIRDRKTGKLYSGGTHLKAWKGFDSAKL